MITSVPITRANLSFAPKVRMAKALTDSGVRVMTASPTAITGEDAAPTTPATSSATPRATAAASRPASAARGRRPRTAPEPAAPGVGPGACTEVVTPDLRTPEPIWIRGCACSSYARRVDPSGPGGHAHLPAWAGDRPVP